MRLAASAPAVVMIGLSAVIVVATFPMGVWDGFSPGAAFFPLVIGAIATVLSAIILIGVFRGEAVVVVWPEPSALLTVALVFAALIAFLFLAPTLGMFPAAIALLAFVTTVALRQPLLGSLVAVVITAALIYGVFVRWLALPIPVGVFGF